MGTSSEAGDDKRVSGEKDINEKHHHAALEVSANEVDTGASLVYGEHGALDPSEALRIRCEVMAQALIVWRLLKSCGRRKIDYHILPLMCSACDILPS